MIISRLYTGLNALESSLDCEVFEQEMINPNLYGISKPRMNHYLEMIQEAGYIDGVCIREFVDGTKSYDTDKIRITIKGLEYLSENSIIQQI